MGVSFTVVIPVRHASSRLPGKPLLDIAGKPLIQHVYEAAISSAAEQVFVATDDGRIKTAVEAFGGRVVLTGVQHKSGTDRIAEAIDQLNISDEAIIINVQGDEFGMPPAVINQLASALHAHPAVPMATLCEKITARQDLHNPNVVKVIFNQDRMAVYFSRSPIPWTDAEPAGSGADLPSQPYRHIGIYGYRAGFLRKFTGLPHCRLEESERLEQLRALYYGYQIYVEEACADCGVGVDTQEDLELARKIAEKNV